MLSLAELRRVAHVLDAFAEARVRAIGQTDEHTVHLRLHVPAEEGEGGARHEILISAHPEAARVSRVASRPPLPPEPPRFSQLLRKHLDRARLLGAEILGDDRQLALHLDTREGRFDLVLSILGPRSNVYLVGGDGVLRGALRPLGETRRDLVIGEPWRSPEQGAPREGEDRFADREDEELLDAIEALYGPVERAAEARDVGQRLAQVVAKEAKRLDRRIEKLEQDAQAGEEAARLHRQGELLKIVMADVETGATEIVAHDYEAGEDVVIPLDPKRSPNANLERIFKRYHKAVKRATVAGGQLAEAAERREALAGLAEEIASSADDPGALQAIAEREEVKKLLRRHAPPPPKPPGRDAPRGKRDGTPARLQPKRYRSSAGLEIWVGKNDEGNDHLTTRLARGKDLFFHLEAQPGSHVILRTEGRADPPQEAVLEACELAVHFSKQRKASRANVHVVPIRNVKKPKRAKPGLVYVHGGKTVSLRRDPARLARVLDAQIPED